MTMKTNARMKKMADKDRERGRNIVTINIIGLQGEEKQI